jgi:hypothetical protein
LDSAVSALIVSRVLIAAGCVILLTDRFGKRLWQLLSGADDPVAELND